MIEEQRYCQCGCGEAIERRAWHRPGNSPRFVLGHQSRRGADGVRPNGRRAYVPLPGEIPSGICECGCGGATELAKHTNRSQGRFAGFPARFIRGHNSLRRGDRHPMWKGGRHETGNGYVKVKADGHPAAQHNGYVLEHRLVMEGLLGRALFPDENVHHINGVRNDNRPENLELWISSQPAGQRVNDKIEWAVRLLSRYAPEKLTSD